jgi:hypothetical protein
VGRDSSVGIATRYGLDGLGIESRWGRDFPQPSRPALGPTQPPVQWVPCLFPRGKTGRGVGLATPSPPCAEAHESVQLYLYSPSWALRPVIGWTFTFTNSLGQSHYWEANGSSPNNFPILYETRKFTTNFITSPWARSTQKRLVILLLKDLF